MLCFHVCYVCYVPILEPSLNAKVAFGCKSYSILLRKTHTRSWWIHLRLFGKVEFFAEYFWDGLAQKTKLHGFQEVRLLENRPFFLPSIFTVHQLFIIIFTIKTAIWR